MQIDANIRKCSRCSDFILDLKSPDPNFFPIPSIEEPFTEFRIKIHKCPHGHQNKRYWRRQLIRIGKEKVE